MAKEDTIEIEGKVLEIIPGGKFKVQLDTVMIELSPYDLTRGRITYRK